jgi:hypothetical protein
VELVFGFNLPYQAGFDYLQTLTYPVDAVVILLMSDEISIHADGLEDLGGREMAGVIMRNYSLGPMESGDTLTLRFGSRAAMLDGNNLLIVYIFAVILLTILAVMGLTHIIRRRRIIGIGQGSSGDSQDDYQAIVKAIAALDDAFEVGDLRENTYRRRRARLKDRALNLMRRDDD